MSMRQSNLVVRSGFRPAGVVLVVLNLCTAAVILWGGWMGAEQGGHPWMAVGVIGLGGLLVLMSAIVCARAFAHTVVAVVTARSVLLSGVADPALREWEWKDIAGIDAVEQSMRGLTVATVFRLQLHPSERAQELANGAPAGFGPSFRVSLFHRPKPRTISDFMRSVAPEQCRALK
ncbi:hypothetical protein nbrc107696_43160 [Gordonia spumicola]|uniref:Uncharacterized protein n=2 Tax=Gordonia spumicola TaxID=589161 RepID=A0A7I9VFS9_9ACTN|nr:hypothetical protein nbrc107696_43160 [Gordonia spumicola]